MAKQTAALIGYIFVAILIFIIGLHVGQLFHASKIRNSINHDVSRALLKNIKRENIRKHLRHLTENIGWKFAGTEAEHDAARYIYNYWKSIGLSHVKMVPYNVLLSYPSEKQPNLLQLLQQKGAKKSIIFEAKAFEDLHLPRVKNQTKYQEYLKSIYIAYSPSGLLEGPIIYVNYARTEDFEYITTNLRINTSFCICLARYGKLFRGLKAVNSERFGCSALILYSDPIDYNTDGEDPAYPFSLKLPDAAVQRGSLKTPYDGLGDFLTLRYPATEKAYRIKEDKANLPEIPVHVLRSDDVRTIFSTIKDGREVPLSWRGGMNISYWICSNFSETRITAKLLVSVKNSIKVTYNVFGYLEGTLEKDRYVMVGNHYDSWGPGAIDPSIGTAAMLELSRAFVNVSRTTNWLPRRSIVFCAWGAEELGSIGSREFVEEFVKLISLRTVAYLNIDVATLGNYSIKLKSHPLLKEAILKAAKVVPNPDDDEISNGRKSVYDTYAYRFPDKSLPTNPPQPIVKTMTTGSDYVHFVGLAGVPCLDIRYTYNETSRIDFYPLYHTAYDNVFSFESYVDPSYKFSVAVTQIWGELTRLFSDEPVVPYSIVTHVRYINVCLSNIISKMEKLNLGNQVLIRELKCQSDELVKVGVEIARFIDSVKLDNLMIRQINDRMVHFEKSFLYNVELKGREGVRHLVFAPSSSGKQICFAVLDDLLHQHLRNYSTMETSKRTNKINEELSRILHHLSAATSALMLPTNFISRR